MALHGIASVNAPAPDAPQMFVQCEHVAQIPLKQQRIGLPHDSSVVQAASAVSFTLASSPHVAHVPLLPPDPLVFPPPLDDPLPLLFEPELMPLPPPPLLDRPLLLDVSPLDEEPPSAGPSPTVASSPLTEGATPRTSRALRPPQPTANARSTSGSSLR